MNRLTRRKLLTAPKGGRAPFKSNRALAKVIECHESYISKWPMDEPMPERYEFRLRNAMPRKDWDAVARVKLTINETATA